MFSVPSCESWAGLTTPKGVSTPSVSGAVAAQAAISSPSYSGTNTSACIRSIISERPQSVNRIPIFYKVILRTCVAEDRE